MLSTMVRASVVLARITVAVFPAFVFAAGLPTLDTVEVTAGSEDLIGTAGSATAGTVSGRQIEQRPLLRPAEVLEVVPGVIVTQHSGDGKANQYFLRGFNLDHGTDFRATVNGIPVNMPTHAHGQGYLDLNFLIPELIERVAYRKGPYWAEEGDFTSAGATHIDYVRELPGRFAELGIGENGLLRGLLAGSPRFAEGNLLYGVEWFQNDGPWQVPENYRRVNAILRYSRGSVDNGWAITGMAYRGQWTATDQVAKRSVDLGAIDRFGSLDSTSGGNTHRYSLGAEWARRETGSRSQANAYLVDYRLRLYSNFTYCLNDFALNGNCLLGDQFEQSDRRLIGGLDGGHTWFGELAGHPSDTTVGIALRRDRIDPVGLYLTRARQRHTTIREDSVTQSSAGIYVQNETQWLERFRSILGWRQDWVRFNVASDTAANSGHGGDNIGGPKIALIFGPWAKTEYYLNYGWGFHSNDVRGATIAVNPDPRDPGFGMAVDKVPPLVRSKGAEFGLRSAPLRGLQFTAALWRLDLDSELLFVGDAGTTEPSRPSKRTGVEMAAYYYPYSWLTVDADLGISRARFTDDDPAGNHIPGAVDRVFSLGVAVDGLGPWFGGIRLRYFGPRSLIEDDSVRSRSSTLVNLKAGYRVSRSIDMWVDVLNLLNREASDIDYYYCSLLSQETAAPGLCADGSAGSDDIHFHPVEPRTFRLAIRLRF